MADPGDDGVVRLSRAPGGSSSGEPLNCHPGLQVAHITRKTDTTRRHVWCVEGIIPTLLGYLGKAVCSQRDGGGGGGGSDHLTGELRA